MNQKISSPYRAQNFLFYTCAFFLIIAFYWLFPLYPQPEHYHHFSGDKRLFGIPNFMNVSSNIFYIIAGIWGIYKIQGYRLVLPTLRWSCFFLALILVGIGSSYYHLTPTTTTLFWDRLPMCLGFAFLSANFLAERYPAFADRNILLLFLGFSLYSVLHWHLGEMIELGDLRLYGITQFATIALIAAILIFHPQPPQLDRCYWILFIGYGAAKVCEMLDPAIFSLSQGILGGHVIKHIVSGIALIYFMPPIRSKLNPQSHHLETP